MCCKEKQTVVAVKIYNSILKIFFVLELSKLHSNFFVLIYLQLVFVIL